MMENKTPSEIAAVVAAIDPDAATAATYNSGWVKADEFESFLGVFLLGDLGADGTVVCSIQCATAADGTGAKNVTGKVSATFTQAGTNYSNKQVLINLRSAELEPTFMWISVAMVVAVQTSDVGALLLAFGPKYGPASANDSDAVTAILN